MALEYQAIEDVDKLYELGYSNTLDLLYRHINILRVKLKGIDMNIKLMVITLAFLFSMNASSGMSDNEFLDNKNRVLFGYGWAVNSVKDSNGNQFWITHLTSDVHSNIAPHCFEKTFLAQVEKDLSQYTVDRSKRLGDIHSEPTLGMIGRSYLKYHKKITTNPTRDTNKVMFVDMDRLAPSEIQCDYTMNRRSWNMKEMRNYDKFAWLRHTVDWEDKYRTEDYYIFLSEEGRNQDGKKAAYVSLIYRNASVECLNELAKNKRYEQGDTEFQIDGMMKMVSGTATEARAKLKKRLRYNKKNRYPIIRFGYNQTCETYSISDH